MTNDDSTDDSQTLVTRRGCLSKAGVAAGTALVGGAATGIAAAQTDNEPRINLGDNFYIDDVDGETLAVKDPSDGSTVMEYDATAGTWTLSTVNVDKRVVSNLGFEAYPSSRQTIPSNTYATIEADTVVGDDTDDYDPSNYQYTTPYDGDYTFRFLYNMYDTLSDQTRIIIQVVVGGDEYRLRDRNTSGSERVIGSDSIHLKDISAGTTVTFEVWQNSGGESDMGGGSRDVTGISGVYHG